MELNEKKANLDCQRRLKGAKAVTSLAGKESE